MNITKVRRSEQSSEFSKNACCCHNDSVITTSAEINISSVESLKTKHVRFSVRVMWQLETPVSCPSSIHRCPSDVSSSSSVWQCVCHWFNKTWIHYRGQWGFLLVFGAVFTWKVYIFKDVKSLNTFLDNDDVWEELKLGDHYMSLFCAFQC